MINTKTKNGLVPLNTKRTHLTGLLKWSILYTSPVAHQDGAYPGFCSMKRLHVGVFLLPLDGMLVHRRVIPSIKVP